MSQDSYEPITVEVLAVRPHSVRVEDSDGEIHWFSRKCIFGPDDLALDELELPQQMTLKVRAWHLRQKGL